NFGGEFAEARRRHDYGGCSRAGTCRERERASGGRGDRRWSGVQSGCDACRTWARQLAGTAASAISRGRGAGVFARSRKNDGSSAGAIGMKAYLLDDEPLAVSRLTRLLGEAGRVQIAGSSNDPSKALAEMRRERPDVLFLDIEMPGLSGFQVLEQ